MAVKCLSCGKLNPNEIQKWEDGLWICLNCRKTAKVPIRCSVCNVPFGVKWDTYRMKDPSLPWRCRRCNDKYRNKLYDEKSPEEKKAFVDSQIARTKAYYANRTEEEIKADSERRKKVWADRKARGDDVHIINAMKEGRRIWYESLSDEEKYERIQFLDNARREWLKSLSAEELAKHNQKYAITSKEMWANRSEEEKNRIMSAVLNGVKEFWANMAPEEFGEWAKKIRIGMKEHYDNLDSIPNPVEFAFSKKLQENSLEYEWQYASTTKHPHFDKLFPENPVTGGRYSGYHFWDFMVRTKHGDLLIDVDGSQHAIQPGNVIIKNEIDAGRDQQIRDSQRIYQNDGLDAFIIEAYDDELADDTQVLKLNDGKRYFLKEFMTYLNWLNLTDEEQRAAKKKK